MGEVYTHKHLLKKANQVARIIYDAGSMLKNTVSPSMNRHIGIKQVKHNSKVAKLTIDYLEKLRSLQETTGIQQVDRSSKG